MGRTFQGDQEYVALLDVLVSALLAVTAGFGQD